MPVASVERLEIAHVGCEGGAEGVVIDGPAGLVRGMALTVLLDQAVQKLEQVPGCAQVAQRILQRVVADGLVHEVAQPRAIVLGITNGTGSRTCAIAGRLAVGRGDDATGPEPVAGQVVKRRPAPAQGLDHVELVGASPVIELLVFFLQIIGQLNGEQQLEANSRVPEKLVIQQRPDQGAHLAWIALDLLRFIDPVDQHDDAAVPKGVEHALELAQQFVAFLGSGCRGRQGLSAELGGLEPEQLPAQGRRIAAEHLQPLANVAGIPLCPQQPPAPVDPAGENGNKQPGENTPAPQERKRGDQGNHDQRRAKADLQVATAPEGAESGAAAEPAPAALDRLAGRGVVKCGKEQEIAPLVETEHREVDLLGGQQVNQLGDPEREDGVHVVLQLPAPEDVGRVGGPDRSAVVVEVRIEIVIGDDEDPLRRIGPVEVFKLGRCLESQRRLAAALLTENQGGGRVGGAAEKFVPGRMVDREQTLALEHRVGLSILLAEWVTLDAMMLQELFRLHPWGGLSIGSWNWIHSVFVSRSHSSCLNRFGVPPQSQAVDASLTQVVGCTYSIANTRETKARQSQFGGCHFFTPQAMRARSSRATKSVCSGEFRPCWTMANTALTSPRIKAAGSSQRPGNTVLRRMPSAAGLRGL